MALLRTLVLIGAMAFPVGGQARTVSVAPDLPWWLREEVRAEGPLQLSLHATRDRHGVRVCRTLVNTSFSSGLVVRRIEPTGGDSGLLSFILDEAGNPIRPDDNLSHSLFIPPPVPMPGSSDEFQIIAPRMRISNCTNLTLPRGHSRLWIVSTFRSDLDTREVPASLASGNLLISRDYGSVRSNLCEITGRVIRCNHIRAH